MKLQRRSLLNCYFFLGLRQSPCYEVACMANIASRDLRSTTGSNLRLVQDSSGLDPWLSTSSQLKKMLHQKEQVMVPMQDKWRVQYLGTLLAQRKELSYMGEDEDEKQVAELIESLCINWLVSSVLMLLLKAPTKFNSYLLKHQMNMTIAILLTVSIFFYSLVCYVYAMHNMRYACVTHAHRQ